MTIKEVFDFVDALKPNGFTAAEKTIWLNEVEGKIQTEVMLLSLADVRKYIYSSTYKATGISFPDGATMVCPTKTGLRPYGTITITGLTTYSANNITATINRISSDGKTLYFNDDTFSVTGTTGDAGEATLAYDGSGIELLVPAPHDKLYYTYVQAMIDFYNGEYDRYSNAITLWNSFYDEYKKWYSHHINPANGNAFSMGYYISAYGLAVKHGYAGTEEEWLATLKGDTGATGTGIAEIEQTSTAGNVDTYTITYENGETSDFTVTNGNGIVSVNKVSSVGLTDTYRIVFDNGGHTDFTINNGAKGDTGEQGLQGIQGPKGDKGDKGDKGNTGATGSSIASIVRTSGDGSPGTTDTYTITMTDGATSTFQVYNGAEQDISGKADKVNATNLITNGDFSDGTAGWSNNYASVSASNNVLTETQTSLEPYDILRFQTNTPSVTGHKYFLRVKCKPINDATLLAISIKFYGSISGGEAGTGTLKASYPTSGQEVILGGVVTLSGLVGDFVFSVVREWTSDPLGKAMEVQCAIAINLTATFGAGNEPTAAEMDTFLSAYPNSWLDGTQELLPIKTLYSGKADKVQEAWIAPTLSNGWSGTLKYYKSTTGVVRFKGYLTGGTAGTTAVTMPAGYRISGTSGYFVLAGAQYGSVHTQAYLANGLSLTPTGNSTYWHFESMSYRAEA